MQTLLDQYEELDILEKIDSKEPKNSPFLRALEKQYFKIAQKILEKDKGNNIDLNRTIESSGNTALHIAIQKDWDLTIIQNIIEKMIMR